MTNDELGNRMKANYEDRTRHLLPRRTYTIIRVDGKAFHTLTRHGFEKPYDKLLMKVMDDTAIYMCQGIQGAVMAYVQSDEISILLTDFEGPKTEAWFDGNIQKISSISASLATVGFNKSMIANSGKQHNNFGMFDSRVFTIPDPVEVQNYFIWRQQDATRNSIQMAARAVYSHSQCENKNTSDLNEMLFQKGINWNNYTTGEKRGRVILKESEPGSYTDKNGLISEFTRQKWVSLNGNPKEIPIFTQDRSFLGNLIPKMPGSNFGSESK